MTFNAGAIVGPYRVLEQLGQGGMATVYKAYHASLDRYVAIKVLHQAFLEDPNFLARFQREARLVARLEHPNIVPIYDYAEHEGQPYLVMKYIEGETLKARLQRSLLSPTELVRIIEKVGEGLAYAHKQGILHRDIKPSNVILAQDGGIYLADFGLARIAQAGESTLTSDMVLGTPQYISPEQALGKKDLDEGTDIYSFGVMLYEMTTGRVPFSADTPFSVIHDHISSPLPLPTSVNPQLSFEVERVLLKALSKEREDRYRDVPAFVQAFQQAWSEHTPTQAAPSPAPQTASQPQPLPAASAAASAPTRTPEVAPAAKKGLSRWWLALIPLVLCLFCGLIFAIVSQRSAAGGPPLQLPDGNQIATQVAATVQAAPPLPPVETPQSSQPLPPGQTNPQSPQPNPPQEPIVRIELPLTSIDEARALVRNRPEDPKAHLALGYTLVNEGQLDEGYAELNQSAELAKKQPALLVAMGLALEQDGNWLGALVMYSRAAKSGRDIRPPDAVDRFHESIYYAFQMEIAPDVVAFDMLTEIEPFAGLMAEAQYNIAYGDLALAQETLDQLLALVPNAPEASLLQAEILLAQDSPEAATVLLEALLNAPAPQWVKEEADRLLP